MDNASRIFVDRGFRNVSVEELCEVAGISRATFYKYFPNREALVEILFEECIAELVPAIDENFNSGKDVKQIIETHYNVMYDLFSSKISDRMLADMESQMPRFWERLQKIFRYEAREREKLIKRGQEDGSIRNDLDPAKLIVLLDEMILSVSRPSFIVSKGLTVKEASTMVKTIWLNGILSRDKMND